MINRFKSATILALAATALVACSVKTVVPGFKYPSYAPNTPWPKLSPTADLAQKAAVNVDADLKDVERLKALAN